MHRTYRTPCKGSFIGLCLAVLLSGCSLKPANGEDIDMKMQTGPEDLIGVQWLVERIDDTPVLEGSTVTLNFDADGRIFGKASCNGYGGQYSLSNGVWSFSQLLMTKRLCEPGLMEQERAFTTLLSGAVTIRRVDDRLELDAADGRSLHARTQTGPG